MLSKGFLLREIWVIFCWWLQGDFRGLGEASANTSGKIRLSFLHITFLRGPIRYLSSSSIPLKTAAAYFSESIREQVRPHTSPTHQPFLGPHLAEGSWGCLAQDFSVFKTTFTGHTIMFSTIIELPVRGIWSRKEKPKSKLKSQGLPHAPDITVISSPMFSIFLGRRRKYKRSVMGLLSTSKKRLGRVSKAEYWETRSFLSKRVKGGGGSDSK